MNIQRVIRAAASAALSAMLVAGAGLFPAQQATGREANTAAPQGGETAVRQLNRDGQDQGLLEAFNQARYGITRANSPTDVRQAPALLGRGR